MGPALWQFLSGRNNNYIERFVYNDKVTFESRKLKINSKKKHGVFSVWLDRPIIQSYFQLNRCLKVFSGRNIVLKIFFTIIASFSHQSDILLLSLYWSSSFIWSNSYYKKSYKFQCHYKDYVTYMITKTSMKIL